MSGDFHSRVSADHHDLFASFANESPPPPEHPEIPEDEWSADAPPLPFMHLDTPAGTDGAPGDRLIGALPWIKRAG